MTQISFVGLVLIPEQRENPGTDGTFPQVSEKAIFKTSERPVCPHIFPKLPAVCGEAALHSSQSGEGWGCANVRRIGSGAVFATTQPALRDGWRSSRNGQHENANERREDFVQR